MQNQEKEIRVIPSEVEEPPCTTLCGVPRLRYAALGMTTLILATRNPHKAREFCEIVGPEFAVRDLSGEPEAPEIEEAGTTFAENAILKALGISKQFPGLIVADDSGLEVDALGGAPGVFSARYDGTNATDAQNIARLLVE